MKLIYAPIEKQKLYDIHIIKIEYEHGDADSNTYEEVKLQSISKDDFIKYIERFNEVSKMISDNRSYGSDYNEVLSTEMNFLGYRFPLSYVHHYEGDFAAMSIDSIQYFDKSSQEFKVSLLK
jgi:hypothetical protein